MMMTPEQLEAATARADKAEAENAMLKQTADGRRGQLSGDHR